ncbi:FecR family protein [Chitinophaga jiangningensis]|uniref:FecR family protein n=1 Tax=Chitinophaga jiangningensis TaxID=1419482 RepID=A0A1M6X028_9BACT|nr:FecR domain-containing protein [Chitinophaga jiangningensis]SHK99189.1 FecR family protein [Chitinophaga jiangningensis]
MKKESIAHKYIHYKESDFLTDSYFQEWVYTPTADSEHFWQEVIHAVPQQKEAIENARRYLKSITFATHTPSDEEVEASWQQHFQAIQATLSQPAPAAKVRFISRRTLFRVAAVVAGLVLITGTYLFIYNNNEQLIASTGYGEMRKVTLPDGSQVDLNANSKITYRKNWQQGNDREVWLEGEALFNVSHINKDTNHIKAGEKFLVHTKDLTVSVLGTVFDIRQRRRKTEVVLQSGKIKLHFSSGKEPDIIMEPGQLVAYNDIEKKLITSGTSPEKFSAWKEQKLILQDPKVNDILLYLEDNFGKKIIMENKALSNRTVNGPILISSLDDALFVLSTVLNTEIIKRDTNTIVLRDRQTR